MRYSVPGAGGPRVPRLELTTSITRGLLDRPARRAVTFGAMALDDLRARLDRILGDLQRVGDARAAASGLFEAMVETKTAIAGLKDGLAATARELAVERQHLTDAERRGRLAAEIQDTETAQLAEIWTTKHRERVALLERRQSVQQDELAYAERQLEEMSNQYRQAKAGVPPGGGAGASALPAEPELEREGGRLDREAQAARVQQQLADLKRKLGRQD